ncbi:MAG: hypothetical protein V1774_05195 [Candidatus Eisenbacteria bacterium]
MIRTRTSGRAVGFSLFWAVAGIPVILAMAGAGIARVWLPGNEALPAVAGLENLESAVAAGATLPLRNGLSLNFHRVTVTGFSSSAHETDDTPFLTASMTTVKDGCLALSRDLLRTFTPGAPFDFGDHVLIPGVGVFLVQDTMHERWRERADIWFADSRAALHWGRRRAWIGLLPLTSQENPALFAFGVRVDLQEDALQP